MEEEKKQKRKEFLQSDHYQRYLASVHPSKRRHYLQPISESNNAKRVWQRIKNMVLTLLTQLLLNCLQEFNLGLRYWHEENLVDIFFCYLFDLVSYKVNNVCRIYLDGSILWKMSGLPMKLKHSWVNRHTIRRVNFHGPMTTLLTEISGYA